LPRELELPEDGVLRVRPLRELEKLRYDQTVQENIIIDTENSYHLEGTKGDAVELMVSFDAPLPKEFGINLMGDDKSINRLRITAGSHRTTLGIESINPPFKLKEDEDLTLRIFIDKNLVEIFANDRQAAAVALKNIQKDHDISLFTKDRPVTVKEIKTWKMKSIYASGQD
jgi:beta-fructofuranosidase